MYTRCPHCQTCFRIAKAHLKAAKGMVRCGSCKEVFNASSHIYDNMPDADPNELKANPIIPEDEHQHIDLSSAPDRSNAPDQSKFMESIIGDNSRYNNLDDMGAINIPGDTNFTESFIKFVETEYDPDKKIAAHPVPDPLFEQSTDISTASLSQTNIRPDKDGSNEIKPSEFNLAESKDNLSANPFIEAFSQQQAYQTTSPAPEDKDKPVTNSHTQKRTDEINSATPPPPGTIELEDDADLPPMFAKDRTDEGDLLEFDVDEISKPEPVAREKSEYEDLESLATATTDSDIKGIDDLYSVAQQQMDEPGSDPDKLNQDIEDLLSDAMSLDDQKSINKARHENSPDDNEPANTFLGDINFLDDDQEEPSEVLTQFEEELQNIEFSKADAASFSLDHDDALENLTPSKISQSDELDFGDEQENIEDIVIGSAEPSPVPGPKTAKKRNIDDELPSAEHDLPRALRGSFAHLDRPERPIGVTMAMGAGIFILVLALLGQMVLFRSYQLVNQFPALTSMLTSMCDAIPCRYSGSTDVAQIELLNRNVRSHPSQKNALLISTAFKNNADFNQPYPTIAIRLSDLSGHIVATRYFTPEEYLEGLYNKFLLMESGTPVHVTLAVLDPGDDAINFEFSFL
ncbi:hypothetical protein MNBD_GAMMA21-1146 [hydrothermal vent metagenome]|uniref:Zinc finger/thioredoxin putative domain-containing protein n=1 Tax=hydrothermal vent metagenome TaxID=652676 RepID=A0A3B0ZT63_9ZZZZ